MAPTIPLDTITVELGPRSYPILVGRNITAQACQVMPASPHLVITESRVWTRHGPALSKALGAKMGTVITVPPGEKSKAPPRLIRLIEDMIATGIDRQTGVIAFGGGMIGDLAGLAAALTLRGLPLVHIPTTLLAQVDSAIGGKTAINSRHGKNLIGAFYQPRRVICDTAWLDTLPVRDMRAGYAEVVKYGLLADAPFFDWLEKHGPGALGHDEQALRHIIRTCCHHKARITGADEQDNSGRALLNLGHTFAHALELRSGYGRRLVHGEAVAIGMVMAATLSHQLGMIPAEPLARLRRHLHAVGLPVRPADSTLDWDTFLATMKRDKKAQEGRLVLVLLRGMGQAVVTPDVPEVAVKRAVQTVLADPT